jgi:hypothetical protein
MCHQTSRGRTACSLPHRNHDMLPESALLVKPAFFAHCTECFQSIVQGLTQSCFHVAIPQSPGRLAYWQLSDFDRY